MLGFLRDLHLDRLSFWLGFLAGTLFWLFITRLLPLLRHFFIALKERSQAARDSILAGTKAHLANDTLRLAQRQHVASALFSLDEVVIQPRLMMPALRVEPEVRSAPDDITDQALPYLPEWPELAAVYNAPTFTLVEALQGECNLVLMGRPGSGKTVALAFLAIQVLRRDEGLGVLEGRVPFLVHAADLPAPPPEGDSPLQILTYTLGRQVSIITQPRLPAFCKSVLENGQALLLLDGLDELDPPARKSAQAFVTALLAEYPDTRIVAATSPAHLADLPSLGFAPLALAAWTLPQRRAFTHQWGRLWSRFVPGSTSGDAPEPALLNGWMLNDTTPYTPLELTLKVWAAYAGDARGFTARDAIEAHLRRMTCKPHEQINPADQLAARLAVQRIAARLTLSQRTTAHQLEMESWLTGKRWSGETNPAPAGETKAGMPAPNAEPMPAPAEAIPAADGIYASLPPISPQRTLPLMIENGLLVERSGGRLSIAHPVLTGYLTAETLASGEWPGEDCDRLIAQEDWMGKHLALRYIGARSRSLPWLAAAMDDLKTDPLQRRLFTAARWLPDAPGDAAWRSEVMRRLVGLLQNENLPIGLRARAIAALALSNSTGVDLLFRQLLNTPSPSLRQLGSLGAGLLPDMRAVNDLRQILVDDNLQPTAAVRQSACLALAAIADKAALEALAEALLEGDEDLRSYAAAALANHIEEGHPTLEEAAAHEDLMIRRAAITGLKRIPHAWSSALLEKIQLEDSQWVVKTAAIQAMEERHTLIQRIPQRRPELHNLPWLIAYAGEKGSGVVPGKPALDLLAKAAENGSHEQRLAAMQALVQYGSENSPLAMYHNYYGDDPELREIALDSLWHLAAKGVEIPPPIQFSYA